MLASFAWDMFAYVGIVAVVILALYTYGEIKKGINGRRFERLERFRCAIHQAPSLPLDEAARALREVGMSYRRGAHSFDPNIWTLPEIFWTECSEGSKAAAIITLLAFDKNSYGNPTRSSVIDLIPILVKQARKHPARILAFVSALMRKAGDEVAKDLLDKLERAK